ncbi:MAG: hypothetical protein HGB02_08565 [Chlorobiaceae bacterium]|nr:hypothetical protein [Chlorobiaceae bacterium]
MKNMHYSPSTRGFYAPEIHGTNIPADAVEITAARHAELFDGQSNGQQIVPDENGFPVLIDQEVVVVIPSRISMRQCRLQLLADGFLDDVNSAVATMGAAAQIEWEYASEVERSNPLVPAMQQLLNWNGERVDQFYIEASKL